MAAVKLLKTLEAENRAATPAEKETLAQYTGWGHSPQAFVYTLQERARLRQLFPEDQAEGIFDQWNNEKWEKEQAELQDLFTEDEYTSARDSIANAHYTSLPVIRWMWDATQRFGFQGGKILEPGLGIGNFFSVMPSGEMRGKSKLTGIEMDDLSGRIAQKLYERADVRISPYQKTRLPDGYFDLAISNVPFADVRIQDKAYKEQLTLHNYYFRKSLDKVRPGGVVAFITSRFTMDGSKNQEFRRRISEEAEFIGAIRLPNTAFKKNAHTEVTTDVIFLRKLNAGEAPTGENWVDLVDKKIKDKEGRPVEMALNSYYDRHPDMMMGRLTATGSMYSAGEPTLAPYGDLDKLMATALEKLPENVVAGPESSLSKPAEETLLAPDSVREGQFVVNENGDLTQNSKGKLEAYKAPNDTAVLRIKGMDSIRAKVRDLLFSQTEGIEEADLKKKQANLLKTYKSFAKKYGPLNNAVNKRLFSSDPDVALLSSLEVMDYDESGKNFAEIETTPQQSLKAIPEGKRNTELTSMAGAMRSRGMSGTEIAAALNVANRERCQPPLPDEEVHSIALSIDRYEAGSPGEGR